MSGKKFSRANMVRRIETIWDVNSLRQFEISSAVGWCLFWSRNDLSRSLSLEFKIVLLYYIDMIIEMNDIPIKQMKILNMNTSMQLPRYVYLMSRPLKLWSSFKTIIALEIEKLIVNSNRILSSTCGNYIVYRNNLYHNSRDLL